MNIVVRETPAKDGQWWLAQRTVRIRCCRCNRTTRDYPAVMAYRADLDFDGGSRGKHPRWPHDGWLVWWQCDLCGYTDASGTATDAQVQAITAIAGPWARR